MSDEFAILNHMPWWAAVLVLAAVITGYVGGAWITRDDVQAGLRRYWWRWPK